jgi:two-component sensor histidine kinase
MWNEPIMKNRWLRWAGALALWTAVGLLFAGQLYLSRSKSDTPVSWTFAVGRALADWYVFAVLSIPVFWLARRFRLERSNWPRRFPVHLAASALFSVLWMALRAGIEEWQSRDAVNPVEFAAAFSYSLFGKFSFTLLIYWVLMSVSHTIDYSRKYRERELRAVELEKRLAQAKLQALQMQLNPHFLFNTLHSISSLMHRDVEAADRMIARLSELLRHTLESSDTQEVPLREELDFLQRYLEIEQTRFGERLTVRLEIAPDTLDAQVPNLVLQPLVENAIRHGIEPHAKPGQIRLQARRENGMLRLQVGDNGAGLLRSGPPREGVGLSNTRKRLEQLYGDGFKFEFNNSDSGGLVVSVAIPFRVASNGAAAAQQDRT